MDRIHDGKTIQTLYKNDDIEADIDDLGCDGEGIAHIDGYTVFVPYALPGERVRAHIVLAKPTFAVGKLTKVLRASPDRVEPFCPVYGKCGGCTLQHLRYEAQLRYKKERIEATLRKISHIDFAADDMIPSPCTTAYRNKMSLPVAGVPAVLGFYARNSHRVVPIQSCPIQFEGNGRLIAAFSDYVHTRGIAGCDENTGGGDVRHLVARKLGESMVVTVVATGRDGIEKLRGFDAALAALYGQKYAYYANIQAGRGNAIFGEQTLLLGGNPSPAEIDGVRLVVHPRGFFQVNDGVREKLYAAATSLAEGAHIVDAYSGAGVLSAMLARKAAHVTAVEIEAAAVDSARDMLRRNDIRNVDLLLADCADALPPLFDGGAPDTLVLDPPRAGCAPAVTDAVLSARPRRILYISCNPATLARDLARLSSAYTLAALTPFDMFPHSSGVETLCVLTRK